MATWQCFQFFVYFLAWGSFVFSPRSCSLAHSVSSQEKQYWRGLTNSKGLDFKRTSGGGRFEENVHMLYTNGPKDFNKDDQFLVVDSSNAKAFSPGNKFLMQSYYDRYMNLHDSDFENFMSQEVTNDLCGVLPDDHNFVLRLSDLRRNLIGEGSHRSVSTLIKFQTQQLKSFSELLSYSPEFIIIERLPSGVFADPFELQRLVQRGVLSDVAVFGDTNLELPSFLSNRSAVEVHLVVDPNLLKQPTDINIELPLHARYQPLNESGFSIVELSAPDMFLRCRTKEKVENCSCFFKLENDDANVYGARIVWRIPSGIKVHADLVSAVTFVAALLSTLAIVVVSLYYSNSRLGKDFKQS